MLASLFHLPAVSLSIFHAEFECLQLGKVHSLKCANRPCFLLFSIQSASLCLLIEEWESLILRVIEGCVPILVIFLLFGVSLFVTY